MDSKAYEKILNEFEKSNSDIGELIRLQEELANCENELVAFQIRYVHKEKENEDLKRQLDLKNKLLHQKTSELECKAERLNTLEFHYNELVHKHRLCLECMTKQQNDSQAFNAQLDSLTSQKEKLESEKDQLKELFKCQIENLEFNLNNLVSENENNVEIIKELNRKCVQHESELEDTKQLNKQLNSYVNELKTEIATLKESYSKNLDDKCARIDSNEEKIKQLELELAKNVSKLDQANLQLNELKLNYSNQIKQNEMLHKNAQQNEAQFKEMKINYEKCHLEKSQLNQMLQRVNSDHEKQVEKLKSQLEENCKMAKSEQETSEKLRKQTEKKVKNLLASFNNQQTMVEDVVRIFKEHHSAIKELKAKMLTLNEQFKSFKETDSSRKIESQEASSQINSLQEKCADLEKRYSEKCELLDSLEREIYMTRSSLECAMNNLNSMNQALMHKNEEIMSKNQTIANLEASLNQLNEELNKKKFELNEKFNQISCAERKFKEERSQLEHKVNNLEASLKAKTKQLQQRFDDVKSMSDAVECLKQDKEKSDFKLQQNDNLIKCQKLEIETKNSLIKQLELRIVDANNELSQLKSLIKAQKERMEKNERPEAEQCDKMCMEHKETQTLESNCLNRSDSTVSSSSLNSEKTIFDDLHINLKVKENLIESINDTLVLKDAEIARLKSRIGFMERKFNQDSEEE